MSETVLDRVVRAMRHAGFNDKQSAIAELVGVKQASVSLWRSGQISLDAARTINKATGVCVEWLMTGRGPMTPANALPDQLQDIVSAWPHLSPEDQARVHGFVSGLASIARATAYTGPPERRTAIHEPIEQYQAKNHKPAPGGPRKPLKPKSRK